MFVVHRLGEIGELSKSSEWLWVPTHQNPADHATRWSNDVSNARNFWFIGPDFLRLPQEQWPAQKLLSECEKSAIDKMEMRKANVFIVTVISEQKIPIRIRLLGWRGLLAFAQRLKSFFNRWYSRMRKNKSNKLYDD